MLENKFKTYTTMGRSVQKPLAEGLKYPSLLFMPALQAKEHEKTVDHVFFLQISL